MPEVIRVAVIGAGAVGLGLGSCLLRSGARVRFQVRRSDDATALRERGLERTGIFGSARSEPDSFEVGTSLKELTSWAPDYVLVCTKATASTEVALALAQIWGQLETPPIVILCQNGWGNAELFAAQLPKEKIFNARVITGFRRESPGHVEITVHAEAIRIGSLYADDPEPVLPVCDAIRGGGIPCELSPTIERDLLAKLLYNCALNPLAALRDVPYGRVADNARGRAILEAVVREIFSVLGARGLETHWDSPEAYLCFFYAELLPRTREHESSMLQDLRARRPTEIDALCAAVVDLAEPAGIPTPVNAALATLIRAVERSDPRGSAAPDPA